MTMRSEFVKPAQDRENGQVSMADHDPTTQEDALKPLGRRARKAKAKAMAVRQSLFSAGLDAFERQPS